MADPRSDQAKALYRDWRNRHAPAANYASLDFEEILKEAIDQDLSPEEVRSLLSSKVREAVNQQDAEQRVLDDLEET